MKIMKMGILIVSLKDTNSVVDSFVFICDMELCGFIIVMASEFFHSLLLFNE